MLEIREEGEPMTNSRFVGTEEHRSQPSSKPHSGGGRIQSWIVQIGLDRRCEGVVKASDSEMGWGSYPREYYIDGIGGVA